WLHEMGGSGPRWRRGRISVIQRAAGGTCLGRTSVAFSQNEDHFIVALEDELDFERVVASQRADQFQELDLGPDMLVDGGLPSHQLLGVSPGLHAVRHLVDQPRPFLIVLPAGPRWALAVV